MNLNRKIILSNKLFFSESYCKKSRRRLGYIPCSHFIVYTVLETYLIILSLVLMFQIMILMINNEKNIYCDIFDSFFIGKGENGRKIVFCLNRK
jgi:hypothetical protein